MSCKEIMSRDVMLNIVEMFMEENKKSKWEQIAKDHHTISTFLSDPDV